MKILAFVDVHASKKYFKKIKEKVKKEDPDIILCAGDVSIFEQGADYLFFFLNKLEKPILVIHGNHESAAFMKKVSKSFKNISFVHKTHYKDKEVIVFGYGGGGFAARDDEFKKATKKFKEVIKQNPDKKIILLIHGPPYRTNVDRIAGEYAGNKDIRDFIEKNRIDYVVCGHLHENSGKSDKIKKTIIMNPGPYGKIIKV